MYSVRKELKSQKKNFLNLFRKQGWETPAMIFDIFWLFGEEFLPASLVFVGV